MRLKQTIIATAILSTLTLTGCGGETESNQNTTPAIARVSENIRIDEPESGESTYLVDIYLNKKATENGSIDYQLKANTAQEGSDFIAQSGTIEITEGVKNYTVEIIVKGDELDEDDELFQISLSNPVNVTLDNNEGVFTIKDTDPTPIVSFDVIKEYVSEGNSGYEVKIDLSNASERAINIPFSLSGIATENQDYNLLTENPIVVASGEASVVIGFDIISDSIPEGGEAISISLESPLNAELSDETTATIIIPGDLGLTDTGVHTYFDGTTFLSDAAQSTHPKQDAEFGFDAEATVHTDGSLGFSYLKIDRAGNALPSNSLAYEEDPTGGHRCIRDAHTDLTWETKMTHDYELPTYSANALKDHINEEKSLAEDNNQDFRYAPAQANWQGNKYTYYWYNTNDDTNGEFDGARGDQFPNTRYPVSALCAYPNENMDSYSSVKYCSTKAYIDFANTHSMCGFNNWRLPTAEELRSIHDYSSADPIDGTVNYFNDSISGDYFTSSPSADNSGSAWCMNSDSGQMKLCNKSIPNHIRLVRGNSE